MSDLALYNTDKSLWVSLFKSKPDVNLTYLDGHVYQDGEGCIARFRNNSEAMKTINEARQEAAAK